MKDLKSTDNAKILLIESNKEETEIFSQIVSSAFDLTCIFDQNQALSLLQEDSNKFSTVIVELEIALSFLKKMRKIRSLKNIPVIVSSETSDSELEDELLALGVIYFLKKPYNKKRVLSRISVAVKLSGAEKSIITLEHDELTGLYTRQAFLQKTEQIRNNNPNKEFCIIGFDFENFKSTNTLYGEKKCNEFLAYTAKKLMEKVPYGISGRFGGDQYILFLEGKGAVDLDVLSRIQKSILDSAPIPHQNVKVGIYAPIDSECSMVLCCDRAFIAIREIKGIYGKDVAFFESTLLQHLLDEQRIIETMERGLQNGEFKVFYQPKHEVISGNIAGAEALVRWEHPEYGFLQPNQFIPLFERNGFISKLDSFILEQVCKDVKRWQDNGFPLVPISVNISRHDLLTPECLEKQLQIVDSFGINHNLLHIEVTESLYSENTDVIISQVKKAQELGFLIEMDDFGSGYSSLGLLSSFPLDILKLDISFVRNIKANEIVVENIIKMAHRMGLLTVAEGAESNEQFSTLKGLGCDFIQGFYFSRPLSVQNFESYLKKSTVFAGSNDSFPKKKKISNINENLLIAANEVAESLPGGFFSCHAGGDQQIIAFNSELMRMYGCSTSEEFRKYIGNSFVNLIYEKDHDHVVQTIYNQITPENDTGSIDFRIKTKDEQIKYVRTYGRFVRTEKYGDIFYVFMNDITEERNRKIKAEQDRLKKIELTKTAENATAEIHAKNIFMYNIAKEIINPMQSIIKYTKEIQDNISDVQAIQVNLLKARESEEQLLGFINNVVELSKLENGETKLREIPTDISNAVELTYALIKEPAEKKKIKVEYWSEIKNPYIYQDIFHTTQIVMNIVLNAIKYTPEGGRIKFGLRQYEGRNENECAIEFICEDTGIGISEEFLPHIFENFSREDNQINRDLPSSGLGLNIAKKLLNLMNGTIEISTKQGEGTIIKTTHYHRYANLKDIEYPTSLSGNLSL